ncbi:MAG: 30S ribosomal protein S14 [Alphaproteobacteria bacterium]|nr:30S ribosomal protein S14 [Alphaproteobacteria bacterium]
MAKKSAIETNKNRAEKVAQLANKRRKLKEQVYDRALSLEERFAAQLRLSALPRNSAKNRLRNRCELSGRPRGYYRKFGLSRIALRELALSGKLPGVVKSSW